MAGDVQSSNRRRRLSVLLGGGIICICAIALYVYKTMSGPHVDDFGLVYLGPRVGDFGLVYSGAYVVATTGMNATTAPNTTLAPYCSRSSRSK